MSNLSDLTDTIYAAHDGLRQPNALVKTVGRDDQGQIASVREASSHADLMAAGFQAINLILGQSPTGKNAEQDIVAALVAAISFCEVAIAAGPDKPQPKTEDLMASLHGLLGSAGYQLAN